MLDNIARSNAEQVAGVAAQWDRYASERKQIDPLVAHQKRQDAELAAKKKVIQAEVDRLRRCATGSACRSGHRRS